MLRAIYTFFLGLLLALFVGLGVSTFYSAPKAPTYPDTLQSGKGPNDQYTEEQKQQEKEWQRASEAYSKANETYDRNVAIIVLTAAVLMLVISLVFQSRIEILSDGLLLGGVFTLVYSIIRSFAGNDSRYSFLVVSVGLVLTMTLGYLKFIKPQMEPGKKASRKS
jgi:uncharacterized membrane protein YkgB